MAFLFRENKAKSFCLPSCSLARVPSEVLAGVTDYVWLYEDTPDFIGGRGVAAIDCYRANMRRRRRVQPVAEHGEIRLSLVAVVIAWVVSGLGVFFLARTFQVLADIKPELTAGISIYSSTGFGKYAGFQIAWGYWLSSAFGNVGFGILLMDTMNYFFPPFSRVATPGRRCSAPRWCSGS